MADMNDVTKAEKKQVTLSTSSNDASEKTTLKHQGSLSRLGRLKLDSITQYSEVSATSLTPVTRTHPLPGAMRFRDLSRRALFITSRLAGFNSGTPGGRRLDMMSSNSSFTGKNRGPSYENTYRLEPDPEKKFNSARIQKMVIEVLKEMLPEDQPYDPADCAKLCLKISDVIRSRMRVLSQAIMPRYKWVCQVMLGAKQCQAVRLASRCLWDPATDNYQCVQFENHALYAVATIHGVYCE